MGAEANDKARSCPRKSQAVAIHTNCDFLILLCTSHRICDEAERALRFLLAIKRKPISFRKELANEQLGSLETEAVESYWNKLSSEYGGYFPGSACA